MSDTIITDHKIDGSIIEFEYQIDVNYLREIIADIIDRENLFDLKINIDAYEYTLDN